MIRSTIRKAAAAGLVCLGVSSALPAQPPGPARRRPKAHARRHCRGPCPTEPPRSSRRSRVEESRAAAIEAKSALFPRLDGAVQDQNEVLVPKTFGLTIPGFPSVVGPFNVFDAHLSPRTTSSTSPPGADTRPRAAESRSRRPSAAGPTTTSPPRSRRMFSRFGKPRRRSTRRRRTSRCSIGSPTRAQHQLDAGVATKLDTTRARVQLSRRRQDLLVAQTQRDTAKVVLLRAIGADLGEAFVLEEPKTPKAPRPLRRSARPGPVGPAGDRGRERTARGSASRVSRGAVRKIPEARRAGAGGIQRQLPRRPLLEPRRRSDGLRPRSSRAVDRRARSGSEGPRARARSPGARRRATGRRRRSPRPARLRERGQPRRARGRDGATRRRRARPRAGPIRQRRLQRRGSRQRPDRADVHEGFAPRRDGRSRAGGGSI